MALLHYLRRPALSCLRAATSPSPLTTSHRTFTSLLRPSSLSTTHRPTLSTPTTLLPSTSTTLTSSLLPSISGAGMLMQTRGHRRKTYNPSHIVRKRRFGFLARLRSKTGRNVLKRRKEKGRKMLTH